MKRHKDVEKVQDAALLALTCLAPNEDKENATVVAVATGIDCWEN